METWGLVGFYLLHPTMILGVFLGAVLFLPLVWLLPEDWREVSRRSEHSVPSSTKQQRRQEVLARRSLDKKLNKATKRWRRGPRINGLTKALLTTARLFPIASTSLPCQLAVPFSLCLTLPPIMLQPMLRSMCALISPRFRYLRLATQLCSKRKEQRHEPESLKLSCLRSRQYPALAEQQRTSKRSRKAIQTKDPILESLQRSAEKV